MACLGIMTIVTRRYCNYDWETHKYIKLKNMHKYLAYGIIFGSQLTVSSGVMNYYAFIGKRETAWFIIGITNVVIICIFVTNEVIYRRNLKSDTPLETFNDIDNLTRADFYNLVHN